MDACSLIEGGDEVDCRFDATRSSGGIDFYVYTLATTSEKITFQTKEAISRPVTDGCDFVDGADTAIGSDGRKSIVLDVTLEVQDRGGDKSAPVTKRLRLFPNNFCGKDF